MRKLKRMLVLTVIFGIVILGSKYSDTIFLKWNELAGKSTEVVSVVKQEITVDTENLGQWNPEDSVQETINQTDSDKSVDTSESINVSYVDVGQGDCIIIQDHGSTMMIDTGKLEGMESINEEMKSLNISKIDILLLTHPDADHIQNAPEIITNYGVNSVYMPTIEADTATYQKLLSAMNFMGIAANVPEAGDKIVFGTADYEILGPVIDEVGAYEDVNSYSLVLKMKNGEDTFLFTGDATGEEINEILAAGYDVSANVYKAAHHGSANCGCNSKSFLKSVNPKYVVISCGLHNEYGHPHVETMELLQQLGCNLYRTDKQGTIRCHSTGAGIIWDTAATEDYINGN